MITGEVAPHEVAVTASPREAVERRYYPEIDGLRAVAVLLVLAFHLGVSVVNGGYVGVDVFFVISGYLITSILKRSLEQGRYSLGEFYERRIRRILPALTVMLVVAIVAGYVALLPGEYVGMVTAAVAAAFSFSNLYFWHQAGYFAGPSLTKPLLHTWSLGVEEQFYLLYPLMFAVLYRRLRKQLVPALAILAVLSFAACVLLTRSAQDFAFYWPLTRAWEFLVGALLCFTRPSRWLYRSLYRSLSILVGLSLIFLAATQLTEFSRFPGAAAALPALGAAFVLAGSVAGENLIGRFLGSRVPVYFGRISYSLYLWHWPVIVYNKLGLFSFFGLTPRQNKLMLFVISIALAHISWRYIETPFRLSGKDKARRTVFVYAGLSMAAVVLLAGAVLRFHGFPERYPQRALDTASMLDHMQDDSLWKYRQGTCFVVPDDRHANHFDAEHCLAMDASRPNILIFGDSHAAQLYPGLKQEFLDVNFLQATVTGCKPTLRQGAAQKVGCVALVDDILQNFLPKHRQLTVFLGARWEQGDAGRIGETVAYLRSLGIRTVVFGPSIQYDIPLPRLLAISIQKNSDQLVGRHLVTSLRVMDAHMAALAAGSWHTDYVSFYEVLCSGSKCLSLANDGSPLQGDTEHMTAAGSLTFAQRLKDQRRLPKL